MRSLYYDKIVILIYGDKIFSLF